MQTILGAQEEVKATQSTRPAPQIRRPAPYSKATWDGVERRSGSDRRSGKDRRHSVGSLLRGALHWLAARPNVRSGEDRRQRVEDRRGRMRVY